MATLTLKPNVIFVLGAPGSGKGTQSSKIIKNYNFAHLSAGDLLREEMKLPGSIHGELIQMHIDAGTIVPVEVTCSLLKRRIEELHSDGVGVCNFLVDGFPRNWDNVYGWEKMMSNSVNLAFVLYLDTLEDICITRCLNRCDSSGRTDDNVVCLKKRMLTFKQDTVPIINYYSGKELVEKVDSTKTPDEVFQDIRNIIEAKVPQDMLQRTTKMTSATIAP